MIDEPGPVRAEDAPPLPALLEQLRAAGLPFGDQVEVRQYPGGASNLTFLLREARGDQVLQVVLRQPPGGQKAKGAHDMVREARILQALSGHLPVPRVRLILEDPAVVGAPAYVMDRVEGLVLRRKLPVGLQLTSQQARDLGFSLVDQLAALHQLDPQRLGLHGLDRGPGYAVRQVEGWAARFEAAQTPDGADLRTLAHWLRAHLPPERPRCLIHNDWRLDNWILAPRPPYPLLAILDWEMATVGDGWMDLGNALAYWVQADDPPALQGIRRQPSHLPGMPTRRELVERYAAARGEPTPDFRFEEVAGLFRLAVIFQQIYFRYYHRQTTNPAFAELGALTHVLDARARALMSG